MLQLTAPDRGCPIYIEKLNSGQGRPNADVLTTKHGFTFAMRPMNQSSAWQAH